MDINSIGGAKVSLNSHAPEKNPGISLCNSIAAGLDKIMELCSNVTKWAHRKLSTSPNETAKKTADAENLCRLKLYYRPEPYNRVEARPKIEDFNNAGARMAARILIVYYEGPGQRPKY